MLQIQQKIATLYEKQSSFLQLQETLLKHKHNTEGQGRERYTMQRLTKSERVSSFNIR